MKNKSQSWVKVPALLLINSVILGKLLKLPQLTKPQFPHP